MRFKCDFRGAGYDFHYGNRLSLRRAGRAPDCQHKTGRSGSGQVAWDPVLRHEGGNAVIYEEAGLLGSFEFEGGPGVATAGKNDDTCARGLRHSMG